MATGYSPSVVTDGLVLCLDAANSKSYPGSGLSWKDLSSNHHDGSLKNSPTYNQNYFSFDGTNDFSDHGDILDLGTSDMTINVWIRLLSVPVSNDWIVCKARAAPQSFRYGFGVLAGTSQLRTFFCPLSSTDILALGATSLSTDTWYMATGVWDRSGHMKIYLNGVPEVMSGVTDISSYSSYNFQSTNPYRVGAYTASDNVGVFNPFHGDISYVMHYSRVLEHAEIQKIFNATRSRFGL